MRKFYLLLAALLIAGQAWAATPGFRQDPGTGDVLGQGKYQSDAHKIFRMVRYVPATYSGASTLAANSVVIWDLTSDDGVTVSTSTTSADSAIAGIIVTQALTPDVDGNTAAQDAGKGNWTWLQTFGLTTVNLSTAAGSVAGDSFGISTTAGEVAPFTVQTKGNQSNPRSFGIGGFIYDAATGGDNDVQVFLKVD